MNIYEFRIGAEKEWVCAFTLVGAMQFYLNNTSMHLIELDKQDDVVLIPESEWGNLKIINPDKQIDDNYQESETGDYEIIKTFAEFMKTATKPAFIATTCI